MSLCKYKNIFGEENTGVHQYRIFDIAIIEQCCFKSKHEAITHERYLVNMLDAVLNERVPGRTSKEWYEDNKEEVMMRQKQN